MRYSSRAYTTALTGAPRRNDARIRRGRTHHADPLTTGERSIDAHADLARGHQFDAPAGA